MSENDSSGPARLAELLLGANAAGGKEVYEYTPDPGSIISHASSTQDAYDRGMAQSFFSPSTAPGSNALSGAWV